MADFIIRIVNQRPGYFSKLPDNAHTGALVVKKYADSIIRSTKYFKDIKNESKNPDSGRCRSNSLALRV